ncbi:MAG TPA: hypothetical protein DDW50_16230, partial [Firmicutes bacterium]|nr:hypothetical protein [Bacillota bacterium]
MNRGSVAIAALKLVDPMTRRVLSRDRWHYAIELSKLLLDLHYEVAWFQIGDGWKSQLIPGVPLFGVLQDSAQLFTWPKASDDFYEKTHGFEWTVYFDLILAYPQVHEVSIAISHGIAWDDPLFESLLPTETEREEWKRRLWMALRAPQKVVTVESGLIHWATATWPGLYNSFEYIPNFVPSWVDEESPSPGMAEFGEHVEGSIKILFSGAMTPEAGISETIRAMESLLDRDNRLEFYLFGYGSEATVKYLMEWAEKHPRSHFQAGLIPGKVLAQMDIVLFPGKSCQETSMSCLAAMSLGKTVIVGQNSG